MQLGHQGYTGPPVERMYNRSGRMSKPGFTLRYLTQTAVGVPRDLANTLVISKLKAIRPTVLIYNCTWVCDARCEMCNNWKWGNRKEDMTLEQVDGIMDSDFWHAVENLNISGGEPTTRNDLPEMVELFHRRLPRMRKVGINTTGLTPTRAIPMLTRIVEFCASHRLPDQHPRLARRHRRRPRSGAARQARVRQGVADDRGDAGARREASELPVRPRLDDFRDQHERRPAHPRVGACQEARHRVQHAAVHRCDAAQR